MIILFAGEELGSCPACGHALDLDGKTLGGSPFLRVIQLTCERPVISRS